MSQLFNNLKSRKIFKNADIEKKKQKTIAEAMSFYIVTVDSRGLQGIAVFTEQCLAILKSSLRSHVYWDTIYLKFVKSSTEYRVIHVITQKFRIFFLFIKTMKTTFYST